MQVKIFWCLLWLVWRRWKARFSRNTRVSVLSMKNTLRVRMGSVWAQANTWGLQIPGALCTLMSHMKKESKQHLFRKYANPRMQKRTEGNSGEIGNWPTYPLGLARSFMRSWWESLEILSGGPKIALKQPPESKCLKNFLHLSLFLKKICEDERKS